MSPNRRCCLAGRSPATSGVAEQRAEHNVSRPDVISLDLIRTLVGYDTTSRDSNLALIGFVQDYLGKLGIECRLVHDEEKRKANLYATLGPTDRPGIMLSGHTDVVPVDGQDWATDPFQATEKEGRLYGRGTADMKSFLAIALAFAPRFLERGLKTPIHQIGRAHV